ncbi:MAG: site-specific integrase, partial [Hyphomicrobiales bacterium]
AARQLPDINRLFIETLAWTGGRITEVLNLTPLAFDLAEGTVTLMTLKRRKRVLRQVPLPSELLAELDQHFDLRAAQRDAGRAGHRLWTFSRVTGWRIIKQVMCSADIFGERACARGFRHGFGVGAVRCGVPITLIKRWLGHARLSTTEIYLGVVGDEERSFARRFWSDAAPRPTSADEFTA